jgi:SAM-dependent methyltransferase
MPDPSPLTQAVTDQLRHLLAGDPSPATLEQSLRLLAKWRAQILANTLRQRSAPILDHGPFKGMIYDTAASEGGYIPRRLGCYEASLAPVIEQIIARAYPLILDIGCAEGYYAIGLARRMPQTRILARDSDPRARALCADLAAANSVADRIEIGGEIDHEGLGLIGTGPALILCDIEGAEDSLLDPVAAPALAHADILVEAHDGMRPGLSARLAERFAATHSIRRIDRQLDDTALPDWAKGLSDMDRLLMLWEWRSGPTPWLWMQSLTVR